MSADQEDEFIQIMNRSKSYDEAVEGVREFVVQLREKGESKEAIHARMLELAKSGVPEAQWNILADVADCLVGWCGPDTKID